tara:strand:- start:479 stop:1033 length:555 start_codon:yes stop_codon:yes gene_type:complete
MKFKKTKFKDVLLIEPKKIHDSRGYFFESLRIDKLNKCLSKNFVVKQENESFSSQNVLRGLHFQRKPFAQAKLVRVILGKIIDFVVDIRIGSKNYGKTICFNLSDENNFQVFVPEGFAHGFYVLSKKAIINYKVNNYFSKDHDDGISFQNNLYIKKILKNKKIILSEKDTNLPLLQEAYKGFKF